MRDFLLNLKLFAASYFRRAITLKTHTVHADVPKALKILKRAGVGRRPVKGDELPRSSRK